MSAARYRLVHADGRLTEDGPADVRVSDGALVLALDGGDVLRVPFGLIGAAGAADGFAVRIALANGTVIELSQLGRMRTQLLAELRDGQAGQAATGAGAVGPAEVFAGQDGHGPAQARVYDDALLVTGNAGTERAPFSFITDVAVADYTVTVSVLGRDPLVLSRLGRRTGELARLLSERRTEARVRTSALLAALRPDLDPEAIRRAAAELRDGVAVPMATLDQIAPGLAGTLLEKVTAPERQEMVAELGRVTTLALGFRQVESVRREAVGTTEWRDPAVTPHIGAHGDPGSLSGWWYGGYGGFAGYGGWGLGGWGFGGRSEWHEMTPRANVTRGDLTPATEDLSALSTAGDGATVIAFVLGQAGDRVVFDVISRADGATLVYRADGVDAVAGINRELDQAGFGPGAPGGALARALVGQAERGPDWAEQLSILLNGAAEESRARETGEAGGTGEAGEIDEAGEIGEAGGTGEVGETGEAGATARPGETAAGRGSAATGEPGVTGKSSAAEAPRGSAGTRFTGLIESSGTNGTAGVNGVYGMDEAGPR